MTTRTIYDDLFRNMNFIHIKDSIYIMDSNLSEYWTLVQHETKLINSGYSIRCSNISLEIAIQNIHTLLILLPNMRVLGKYFLLKPA
jgi:hypothetical protein